MFKYSFYIDGWAKQRPISPSGWRTTHLTARTKNVLYLTERLKNDPSRCADEERRISALLRPCTSQPRTGRKRYDVLRRRGEMVRSSTGRWDTTFFVGAGRWFVLLPLSEIGRCSAQPSIYTKQSFKAIKKFRFFWPKLVEFPLIIVYKKNLCWHYHIMDYQYYQRITVPTYLHRLIRFMEN